MKTLGPKFVALGYIYGSPSRGRHDMTILGVHPADVQTIPGIYHRLEYILSGYKWPGSCVGIRACARGTG
jgi:hypothetical protein